MSAKITDHETIRNFLFAGNATFTLVSVKTGTRFTYKVKRADGDEEDRPYFIGLLSGTDNESSYSYMGVIFPNNARTVRFTAKSRVRSDAPSAKGFCWFLARLLDNADISGIEFWHAGSCGACGRKLTVPESIASGLGPVCAGKGGHKTTSRPSSHSHASDAKTPPPAAASNPQASTQPQAAAHAEAPATAPSDTTLPSIEEIRSRFDSRLKAHMESSPEVDELTGAYIVANLLAGRCPDGCCGPGGDSEPTPYSLAVDNALELVLKSIACRLSDAADIRRAAASE